MRELLFRLIKDGKVVGYEKAMYVDALQSLYWRQSEKGINWHVPLDYTIPHDRKDQYTGIEVDGKKVFEGDELKMPINQYHWDSDVPSEEEMMCGYVRYKNGTYVLAKRRQKYDWLDCHRMWNDGSNDWESLENNISEIEGYGKILGIEGVDDDN